jgi:tRNA threonylcarbamoyladenosine biosynthesis protein TsaB
MQRPPAILSVETATLGGSVCIARGDKVLASRAGDSQISHSNSLLKDINESLDQAEVSLDDISLFACASGPGSFTGLRIGLATIKGLATTLERPCVGIPTLHAIAHAAGPSSATISLLQAGRGEVFAQMLSVSPQGLVEELDKPQHLSPQKLLDRYGSVPILTWAGPAARKNGSLLEGHAKEKGISFSTSPAQGAVGWVLVPEDWDLAAHVASLALQRFERGEVVSPESLRAIYVRPSDAELMHPCQ